jgi:hypothetical protein
MKEDGAETQPTRAEELTWAITDFLDTLPCLALGGDFEDEVLVTVGALVRLRSALATEQGAAEPVPLETITIDEFVRRNAPNWAGVDAVEYVRGLRGDLDTDLLARAEAAEERVRVLEAEAEIAQINAEGAYFWFDEIHRRLADGTWSAEDTVALGTLVHQTWQIGEPAKTLRAEVKTLTKRLAKLVAWVDTLHSGAGSIGYQEPAPLTNARAALAPAQAEQ